VRSDWATALLTRNWPNGLLCGERVRAPSLHNRIVIALHSPYELVEPGLRICLPENGPGSDRIRCGAVRSLRSGLSGNSREIRALFAYLGAKPAEVLRSPDCVAERGANLSPAKFPANRENNKEFARFWAPKPHSCSLNCTFCGGSTAVSVNRNRELTGAYQRILFPVQDLLQGFNEETERWRQMAGVVEKLLAEEQ